MDLGGINLEPSRSPFVKLRRIAKCFTRLRYPSGPVNIEIDEIRAPPAIPTFAVIANENGLFISFLFTWFQAKGRLCRPWSGFLWQTCMTIYINSRFRNIKFAIARILASTASKFTDQPARPPYGPRYSKRNVILGWTHSPKLMAS